MWFARDGMNLSVDEPQSIVMRDQEGQQQGANHWAGLREIMDEQLDGFWEKVNWHRHSCNLCRKTVVVDGVERSVKAGVIDGITATRVPCCAVHECPLDLENMGRSRLVPM
ncbi:unnamed protein product [Ectocarpus sp. 12 AP-2014]